MGMSRDEERVTDTYVCLRLPLERREMSARSAGWSAFRQCIAAFKDLILHCWLRQRQRRRQRTASPSQVFFFSFFFFLSLLSEQSKGGEEMQRKKKKPSVPICSFLPLPSSSLSSSEKALPQNQKSHSLISICGESLLGGENIELYLRLGSSNTLVCLRQARSCHYHPILFVQARTSLHAV